MSNAAYEKPTQLRLPSELKTRVSRIAEMNHLSEADVIRLCLAQTLPVIEKNGITILPPAPARKAA